MYIVYTIYYRSCFETTYFLYESAFCPHETSESPEWIPRRKPHIFETALHSVIFFLFDEFGEFVWTTETEYFEANYVINSGPV